MHFKSYSKNAIKRATSNTVTPLNNWHVESKKSTVWTQDRRKILLAERPVVEPANKELGVL